MTRLLELINTPIFYMGQTAITLGGLGSAVVAVVASFFVSVLAQRVVGSRLSKKLGLDPGVTFAVRRVLHYVILMFGAVVASQCVGLNLGTLAVVLGFLSVGIGFGLQNITANFISGLILLFERPVSVGDFVSVGDQMGTVVDINIRSTLIRTQDHISIILPNSQFVDSQVINWSHSDPKVRLHIPIGVAYGSEVERVKEALLDVARTHEDVLDNPEPEVRLLGFGDSALNFDLLVWTMRARRQFLIQSELNFAIEAAFRTADIHIPFPQRDVHVQMTPAVEQLTRRS